MLLHADSFEHYGTTPNGGRDAMLAGMWTGFSGAGGGFYISSTQARTGTKSLQLTESDSGGVAEARFALGGAPKITCGLGNGIYLPSLPSDNVTVISQMRDTTNTNLLTVCVQSDGSIAVRKGGVAGAIVDISDSILQAGTFNHMETKAVFDTVAGFVEIRVNGVTKLQIGSLNLGAIGCTQMAYVVNNINLAHGLAYDDVFAWDDTGSENNDFIGAQRMLTFFADADTAQADWVPTGAVNGFACIDDVPPDADTTYISSDTVGDKSDFALPTLPPETASIAAVFVPVMARVDSAGIGNILVSMISGADDAPGNDVPLTPGYSYYKNVFEQDPATGLPWTKAGLEAALLRIEKSL